MGGVEASATSALRQIIENTEQNVLGTEKHAALEKTEQSIHATLGPYTDWYILGGVIILVGVAALTRLSPIRD